MPQQIEVPGMGVVEFPDGMSDDAIAAALKQSMPPQPNVMQDVAKSAGSGFVKGVSGLVGLPDLMQRGVRAGMDYLTGTTRQDMPVSALPSAQTVQSSIEQNVTGELHKPETKAGQYAQTVGEFGPGIFAGPGGIARRGLAQVLAPGVASEAAGQATTGTAAEPYARFGGAVAGSMAPGALARALNPMRPSVERNAAGNVLRQEGITPTAGQETGSPLLRALESPFGANPEPQLEALTAAAMRRTGEAGGRASRENVDNMFTRLGNEFDGLAARNTAAVDQQLVQDLGQAVGGYNNLVSAPNRAPVINNYLQEIYNAARTNGGAIPGATYQSLRSRMEATARSARGNEVSIAIREMREALDDAMERSIAAMNPGDLGAWQQVRTQYRNALVVERAATSGGENVAQGLLTPGKLSQAVTSTHGRRNRARGQGDFSELSDAADALLRPLPNSGTPVRAAAAAIPTAVGSGLGALAGLPAGPVGSVVGGMAGAGLGHALMAGLIRNPASQAYLAGRIPGQALLRDPSSTIPRDALVQALMQSRQLAPPPR
jgi:hypothetical protein